MTSLARSLLAVTALVAVNGNMVLDMNEPPGSLCRGLDFVVGLEMRSADHRVQVSFNFTTFEDTELHRIEDHCKEIGLQITGQTVRVCNGYKLPSAPNWFPPAVRAVGDQLSPVFASCRNNPQCKPIEFHVNQTCV